VVPTRLFGEMELAKAADAGIATIPGGSLKVSEPHFVVCHRLDIHQRAVLSFINDFSQYLGFLIFVIEAIFV
jgi:hypothetical protein